MNNHVNDKSINVSDNEVHSRKKNSISKDSYNPNVFQLRDIFRLHINGRDFNMLTMFINYVKTQSYHDVPSIVKNVGIDLNKRNDNSSILYTSIIDKQTSMNNVHSCDLRNITTNQSIMSIPNGSIIFGHNPNKLSHKELVYDNVMIGNSFITTPMNRFNIINQVIESFKPITSLNKLELEYIMHLYIYRLIPFHKLISSLHNAYRNRDLHFKPNKQLSESLNDDHVNEVSQSKDKVFYWLSHIHECFDEYKDELKFNRSTHSYGLTVNNNVIPILCEHEYMYLSGEQIAIIINRCIDSGICVYCGQSIDYSNEELSEIGHEGLYYYVNSILECIDDELLKYDVLLRAIQKEIRQIMALSDNLSNNQQTILKFLLISKFITGGITLGLFNENIKSLNGMIDNELSKRNITPQVKVKMLENPQYDPLDKILDDIKRGVYRYERTKSIDYMKSLCCTQAEKCSDNVKPPDDQSNDNKEFLINYNDFDYDYIISEAL